MQVPIMRRTFWNGLTALLAVLIVPGATFAQHRGGAVHVGGGGGSRGGSAPQHQGGFPQPGQQQGGFWQPGQHQGGFGPQGQHPGFVQQGQHPGFVQQGQHPGGFMPQEQLQGGRGFPGQRQGGFGPWGQRQRGFGMQGQQPGGYVNPEWMVHPAQGNIIPPGHTIGIQPQHYMIQGPVQAGVVHPTHNVIPHTTQAVVQPNLVHSPAPNRIPTNSGHLVGRPQPQMGLSHNHLPGTTSQANRPGGHTTSTRPNRVPTNGGLAASLAMRPTGGRAPENHPGHHTAMKPVGGASPPRNHAPTNHHRNPGATEKGKAHPDASLVGTTKNPLPGQTNGHPAKRAPKHNHPGGEGLTVTLAMGNPPNGDPAKNGKDPAESSRPPGGRSKATASRAEATASRTEAPTSRTGGLFDNLAKNSAACSTPMEAPSRRRLTGR